LTGASRDSLEEQEESVMGRFLVGLIFVSRRELGKGRGGEGKEEGREG